MNTTIKGPPMAEDRRKPERIAYVTTKIEARIHRKAKVVAAYQDKNLADYLSELLDKLVEADHQKMRKEMDRDAK